MLALFGFLFVGCLGHVYLEVTKPAEVSMASDIKRLAVFDRHDTDSSSAVMADFLIFYSQLKQPRFQLLEPKSAESAYQKMNIVLGQTLDSQTVIPLCQSLDVDALVALEDAEISGQWDVERFTETETTTQTVTKNGKTETQEVSQEVERYRALYAVDARADWVFYSCKGTVLDKKTIRIQDRWDGIGDTRIEAKQDAGDTQSIHQDIHQILGLGYVQRISPYEVEVSRPLYGGRYLKEGNLSVETGALEDAQDEFKRVAKANTGVKKGKALHNLAVAEEAAGDLQKAFEHAQRAARLTDKSHSVNLKRALRLRLNEKKTIDRQLKQPNSEQKGETSGERTNTEPTSDPKKPD